jgi:hypothetical protein
MKKHFMQAVLMTAVAFALFLCGVFAASFIQKPPTTSTDWAAWVQAVGSIGAIIGAIWIASRQHQKALDAAKAAERERHVRVMEVLVSIAGDVLRFFQHMAEQGPKIQSGELTQNVLLITTQNWASQTGAALNEVPIFDLPFAEVTQDLVGIKQMVAALLMMQMYPDEVTKLIKDPKNFFGRFVWALELIQYNFTEAEKAVRTGGNFMRADKVPPAVAAGASQ